MIIQSKFDEHHQISPEARTKKTKTQVCDLITLSAPLTMNGRCTVWNSEFLRKLLYHNELYFIAVLTVVN